MEEVDDDYDIFDLFGSKGAALDPLKHELHDLQKQFDFIAASNLGKERDIDFESGELRTFRDQLVFARRNIDELVSQQEVLKETIDSINHKKESLIERETTNRDEISIYSGYFHELKEALSVGADWSSVQLEQRGVLEKERDFVSSKLENKVNQLNGLRGDIDRTYDRIQQFEKSCIEQDGKISQVDALRLEIKSEATSLVNKKETFEKQIFDMRSLITEGESELSDRSFVLQAEEKSLNHLDFSIAKSKNLMEQYLSRYDQLFRDVQLFTNDLEKQNSSNDKIELELGEKISSLEIFDAELKELSKRITKVNQLCENGDAKCTEVEKVKKDAEIKTEHLTKQIATLRDSDIVCVRKDLELLDKQLFGVRQELEILRKKHIGSERASKAMTDLVQLNKNGKINLSLEIKILAEEVDHHKSQIRHLLQEKDRFEHDAEVANQQYYTSLEELKLQELQIQELNKKISVDLTKLKQKQSLYESVRSDRNLYSKQLVDSQEEINGLRRKFRSMNHHIDQMKEEISTKDHAIVKEHFLHHSVDKERELLKNELTKIRKQVQSSEVIIENQRVEVMKLQRIIEEADQESQRQKNELSSVLSERNLLTGQLVKRNTELNLMYEKIKVQRSNLRIGERNYDRFLENLASWQLQLVDVVRGQSDTVSSLSKLDDLRKRVIQLERELLREKTRKRSLVDELETPMNVHRWRKLESSEPKIFEKITQIQLLQRQLVAMSDRIIQSDLLVQEKEKIYIELKNVIARQPGPEVEEQILAFQETLKEKSKQLISMNIELDMYLEQVARFKDEIETLDKLTAKMSKKWVKGHFRS